MPRTGRGGARAGRVGRGYSNRADLNGAPTQPVTVAPSAQYGQGAAQAAAQRAIPLPAQPTPGAPMATPVPPQGGATPAPAVVPGALGDFHRPTERPHEALTTGLPMGAGGGPELLNMAPDTGRLGPMLAQLAHQTGSSDLAFLANQAQVLDQ